MKITEENQVQFARDLLTSLKNDKNGNAGKNERNVGDSAPGRFDSSSDLYQGLEQLKKATESGEKDESSFQIQAKCMKIARRIMNGDRVPNKDRQYLAENAPDLMQQALLFRRPNPQPKKFESLVEDDEKTDKISEESDSAKQQLDTDTITSSGETVAALSESIE